MTHDTLLSRGVIALTLTLALTATAVRADVFQPLPRLSDESARDTRRLEPLPPATQPLPRPIEVAQSGTGSLQEALKLLESRVESGTFESAPNAVEVDETPAREPIEPAAPNDQAEIPVSVPQPPVTPAPPIAPVPPLMPVAPETADPSDAPETAVEAPPPMRETPPAAVPSRDESSADAGRATLEAAPETKLETVDERLADTPKSTVQAASAGRWQVQLLSGRSLSRVERDRDDILRFHGERVSGLTLTISQASPNGLYRLRALDWPSRAEAGAWCQRLRVATGLKCMIVRGDESPAPGTAPVDTPPSPATR
jgi:hypothetical protein